MKLGKLGLAASAVMVMALATAAGLHNARAQGFDDEGGRDRSWATKGQSADAPAQSAATADSKAGNAATHSWKAGESATDADYNRRSHSLTRATPGTGVKTPPWAAPSDAKAAMNSEGTVVKTDNGWAHQGTWTGPAADHSAELKVNAGIGAANAAAAPDSHGAGATTTPDNPAPTLSTPSE
jgi:hypothetical protein